MLGHSSSRIKQVIQRKQKFQNTYTQNAIKITSIQYYEIQVSLYKIKPIYTKIINQTTSYKEEIVT